MAILKQNEMFFGCANLLKTATAEGNKNYSVNDSIYANVTVLAPTQYEAIKKIERYFTTSTYKDYIIVSIEVEKFICSKSKTFGSTTIHFLV